MEPFADAIVCDDVRWEDNGKAIIIGIYTYAMIFETLPATVGQIVLWLTVYSSPENAITKFTVNVSGPGEFKHSSDHDFSEEDLYAIPEITNPTKIFCSTTITLREFHVSEPGLLTVTIEHSGGELLATRLPIRVVSPPEPTVAG